MLLCSVVVLSDIRSQSPSHGTLLRSTTNPTRYPKYSGDAHVGVCSTPYSVQHFIHNPYISTYASDIPPVTDCSAGSSGNSVCCRATESGDLQDADPQWRAGAESSPLPGSTLRVDKIRTKPPSRVCGSSSGSIDLRVYCGSC